MTAGDHNKTLGIIYGLLGGLLGTVVLVIKLKTCYETVSKSLSAKASSQQLLMKVRFFPSFIYGVFSQRKSFLGIDFSQLHEVRETSV